MKWEAMQISGSSIISKAVLYRLFHPLCALMNLSFYLLMSLQVVFLQYT